MWRSIRRLFQSQSRIIGSAVLVLVFPATLWSQSGSQDYRVQIANLTQDVRMLMRQVGELRLEVEELSRENRALRSELVNRKAMEDRLTEITSQFNSRITALRSELERANEKQRDVIVKEVGRQISDLAEQTQKTIEAMGRYAGFQGSLAQGTSFSEDYPKSGIAYTVRAGDTIDGIARRHGSTVRDIQNANRIADPRQLRAGETIFVPQRGENR